MNNLEVISGEEIPATLKIDWVTLGAKVFVLVFFPTVYWLMLVELTGQQLEWDKIMMDKEILIPAILLALAILWYFQRLFYTERLIIGEDGYQKVVGTSRVTVNITYGNIEEIGLKKKKKKREYIGVVIDDSDMDERSKCFGMRSLKRYGFHTLIEDIYKPPLGEIYEKLLAKWKVKRKV